MKCQAVILFLIISIYVSAEELSKIPYDDDTITRVNPAMVGDISNKGRRYDVDYSSDTIKGVDVDENINNDLTDQVKNEKSLPLSSRNIRSFDLYDDLYDSYRRKNMKESKNTDPKNLLNDIRSRSSQSNAYNEDQQRRMFFSQIFSLFDDDKNSKRSGKSDDKSKRSKSRIDHETDTFKTFKAHEKSSSGQNKHDSHRKTSLKGKEMEAVNDSFESTIESLLNDRSKSNNQNNDENVTKHRRKNKGRRQGKRNNSRPERQLGDTESYENVESQIQNDIVDHVFISDSNIKNKNKKSTFSQSSPVNIFASSTATIPKIDNEKENSEPAYLVRTPSFNYYQSDVTYPIPDDRRSMENKNNLSGNNVNLIASNENQDKDSVSNEPNDSLNDPTNEDSIQEPDTFNLDTRSTLTDKQNIESVTQQEDVNMTSNDNSIDEKEPLNDIVENSMINQSYVSDVASQILNDLDDRDARRINYISVNKETNRPDGILTVKEEIETPEQELQVTKFYREDDIVAPKNNAKNPITARIKLDLFIQLPSQIDNGNEN